MEQTTPTALRAMAATHRLKAGELRKKAETIPTHRGDLLRLAGEFETMAGQLDEIAHQLEGLADPPLHLSTT
jgi:hypothetical protein